MAPLLGIYGWNTVSLGDEHVHDLHDDHHHRRQHLLLDHAHAVLHVEHRNGHDVEVGRHRRAQRAAVAAGQREDANRRRVGAIGEHERRADAHGHHGDRGERVAHDHPR